MLWEKTDYTNKLVTSLSGNIYEYDMTNAGMSLLIRKDILNETETSFLYSLPKSERMIVLGNLLKKKGYASELENQFKDLRRRFVEANDIKDESILAIKKDALFLIDCKPRTTKFDNVEFLIKNSYTSYLYLNDISIYYNSREDILDVKGLGDRYHDHIDGILTFIKKIMRLSERQNTNLINKYLFEYRNDYLNKELSIEHYREFNLQNSYRTTVNILNNPMFLSEASERDIDILDIGYNYLNVIIQIIKEYIKL